MSHRPTRRAAPRAAIAASILLALPASAQNIGDGFRCAGPDDLPDVLAVVGRTDLLSEILGEEVTPDTTILHLQLVGDGVDLPMVPHATFDETSVAACTAEDNVPFDRTAFLQGFDAYREEVRQDDAGLFTIPPAEAYWLTLGSLAPEGD